MHFNSNAYAYRKGVCVRAVLLIIICSLNLVNLDAKLSLSSRAVLPSWTQAPPWTRDMFTESQSVVSLRLNLKILSQEVISASSCSTNTKILKAAMSIEEKTWSVCLPALVSRCWVNYRKGSCITCIRNFSLQTLLFGRRAADVFEAQPCQTCNTYWRQTLKLGSAPSWPLCRSMWRREMFGSPNSVDYMHQ